MRCKYYRLLGWGVALFLICLAGCGGAVEPLTPADCFDDEIFDSATGECVIDEEQLSLTAADCFEDEYFDEEDRMCYLDEEGLGGWLESVAVAILDSSVSFSDGEEGELLVSYPLENDQLGPAQPNSMAALDGELANLQADTAAHDELWNRFAALVPAENRREITQFGIFTDGVDGTLAYVEPNPDDPITWIIVLDPADTANTDDFTYTLIHEFGHVLTLNDRQVPFDEDAYFDESGAAAMQAEVACSTFFTGEGCAQSTAYISLFFDRFWTEIYDELPFPDEEGMVDEDELADFYDRYADQFVTDYAATNPGEDIAEAWTHFVLKEKPAGGTTAEQKILFFYEFPELVELRGEILQALAAQSRR